MGTRDQTDIGYNSEVCYVDQLWHLKYINMSVFTFYYVERSWYY